MPVNCKEFYKSIKLLADKKELPPKDVPGVEKQLHECFEKHEITEHEYKALIAEIKAG